VSAAALVAPWDHPYHNDTEQDSDFNILKHKSFCTEDLFLSHQQFPQ